MILSLTAVFVGWYVTAMLNPKTPAMIGTYVMVDGVLAWLAYADSRARSGVRVFPATLAIFTLAQASTFFFLECPGGPISHSGTRACRFHDLLVARQCR